MADCPLRRLWLSDVQHTRVCDHWLTSLNASNGIFGSSKCSGDRTLTSYMGDIPGPVFAVSTHHGQTVHHIWFSWLEYPVMQALLFDVQAQATWIVKWFYLIFHWFIKIQSQNQCTPMTGWTHRYISCLSYYIFLGNQAVHRLRTKVRQMLLWEKKQNHLIPAILYCRKSGTTKFNIPSTVLSLMSFCLQVLCQSLLI